MLDCCVLDTVCIVWERNIKSESLPINIFWQCLINMAIIKYYILCQEFFIIKEKVYFKSYYTAQLFMRGIL